MAWYRDLGQMQRDDGRLQALFHRLVEDLAAHGCTGMQKKTSVHVYPSRSCTYTINKRRVFVPPAARARWCAAGRPRMRDDAGRPCPGRRRPPAARRPHPDCVLQYVLLHELAHVLNDSLGHDPAFQNLLTTLTRCHRGACQQDVPVDFNPCHGASPP